MSWSSYSYNIGIYIYNLFTIECCITVFSDGCSQSLEQVLASCLQEFSRRPPQKGWHPLLNLGSFQNGPSTSSPFHVGVQPSTKGLTPPPQLKAFPKRNQLVKFILLFYGVHNPPLKRVYSSPTTRGSDEPSLLTSRMILFAKKLAFRSNYVFEEFKPYKVIDL